MADKSVFTESGSDIEAALERARAQRGQDRSANSLQIDDEQLQAALETARDQRRQDRSSNAPQIDDEQLQAALETARAQRGQSSPQEASFRKQFNLAPPAGQIPETPTPTEGVTSSAPTPGQLEDGVPVAGGGEFVPVERRVGPTKWAAASQDSVADVPTTPSPVMTTPTDDDRGFVGETAAAVARGGQHFLASALGDVPAFAVENTLIPGVGAVNSFIENRLPEAWRELNQKNRQKAVDYFEFVGDFYRDQASRGIEAPSSAVAAASWLDRPWTKAAVTIGEAGPQYAAAIAATIVTKNPVVAAVMFGITQSGSTYREAKEKGKIASEAAVLAYLDGAWTSASEFIPFWRMLGRRGQGALPRIARGSVDEGLQEVIQNTGSNVIALKGFDPGRKIMDNFIESLVAGSFLGGAGGSSIRGGGLTTPEGQAELRRNALRRNFLNSEQRRIDAEKSRALPSTSETIPLTPSRQGVADQQAGPPPEPQKTPDQVGEEGEGERTQARGPEEVDQVAADNTELQQLQAEIEEGEGTILEMHVRSLDGNIKIDKIIVPKGERKQGIGSRALQRVTRLADRQGRTIVLTPTKDFGATSTERLKRFYSRFGFIRNKGRRADLSISEAMFRRPQGEAERRQARPEEVDAEQLRPDQPVAAEDKVPGENLPGSPELTQDPAFRNRNRGFGSKESKAGAVGPRSQATLTGPQTPGARRAQEIFDKQHADLAKLNKRTVRDVIDNVLAKIVDVNAPIARRLQENSLGRESMAALRRIRGASGEAKRLYSNAERKIYGGKVDGVSYEGIPRLHEDIFANYLQAMRTIEVIRLKRSDRDQVEMFPEFTEEGIENPGGMTEDQAQEWIDGMWKSHPDTMPAIVRASELFYAEVRTQIDARLESGLINESTHDFLVKVHRFYSPRIFIQHLDRTATRTAGGRIISVTDSGLKALDKGSEKSLVNDPRFLLGNIFYRTQSNVAQNGANKALAEYVRATPDNAIGATIEQAIGTTQDGSLEYGDVPSGMERIGAMENGVPINILVPEDLADSWVTSMPVINKEWAMFLNVFSGTAGLKLAATGSNPAYALTNFPMDLVHSWFVTTEYNDFPIIAWAQQTADLKAVKNDAFQRKGRYTAYVQQGGSMDYLATQGEVFTRAPWMRNVTRVDRDLQAAQEILSHPGMTSEIWVRLALRERAIKNGATEQEATDIARGYLDFSQGGSWAKGADNIMPYLNSGIQGTRGIFRAFKNNPIRALKKTGYVAGFAYTLALLNRIINEEAWEAISDGEKSRNFIFTTGIKWRDRDGRIRHVYVRIPKDHGQRFFTALGEEGAEKWLTGKYNWERVRRAFTDMLPIDSESFLPPLVSAWLGYTNNRDFWRQKDIWPKFPDVHPEKEYWASTPEVWVLWGKMTGMSPERSRVALTKMIPNHPLTWALGAGISSILPDDDKIHKGLWEQLTTLPFSRRYLRSTWPTVLDPQDIKDARRFDIPLFRENGRPRNPKDVMDAIRQSTLDKNSFKKDQNDAFDQIVNHIKFSDGVDQDYIDFLGRQTKVDSRRLRRRARDKYPDFYKAITERIYKKSKRTKKPETRAQRMERARRQREKFETPSVTVEPGPVGPITVPPGTPVPPWAITPKE